MSASETKLTPKQATMERICDLLHEDARKDGQGLDRDMFKRRNMRMSHAVLKAALANIERSTSNA